MFVRNILKSLPVAGIIFAAAVVIGMPTGQALASDFNSSNIIDNNIFTNSGSMSESAIQSFLNSQDGFLAHWSDTVPMYSTFTFYNSSGSVVSTGNVCEVHQPTGLSAAQIIYDAATDWNPAYYSFPSNKYGVTGCGTYHAGGQDPILGSNTATVNPQVILATIQAQQSLLTMPASSDTINPSQGYSSNSSDYTSATYPSNEYALDWAMGQGFPDSGNTNNTYQSFYNQVFYGAWQLRLNYECATSYGSTSSWTGFDGYSTSSLCLSSDRQVGQSYTIDNVSTTMGNAATASLYDYTPHFSGNENFVTIFEQDFEPVHAPSYNWQIVSQQYSAGSVNMSPGQTETLTVTAENTGTATWYNTGSFPIHLATDDPENRSSVFYDSSWLSTDRPAGMNQSSVAPGQDATFTFQVDAPTKSGVYEEHFNLVAEGLTWFNDPGMYFYINVQPVTYNWQIVSQQYSAGSVNMSPGQTETLTVTAENTGTATWYNTGSFPIHLATDDPENRSSVFYDSSWLSTDRPAGMNQSSVAPGQDATFTFQVDAPTKSGVYEEHFNLVAEGLTWFNDPGMYFYINVNGNYSWQILNQSYSSGSVNVPHGSQVTLTVTAENTGTATWYNTGSFPIHLATDDPENRSSVFYDSSWLSTDRPAGMNQSSVAPGGTATFAFIIDTPATAGVYEEHFNLVAEGLTWFNDPGMYFYLNVQ